MTEKDIRYRVNRGYTMSIYGSSDAIHEEMLRDIVFLLEQNNFLIKKNSAEEAITLFNFYQKESCEIVNGLRVYVRQEYLEQFKTMKSWLKNKHNDYKVIDKNQIK
jgi:hypothetical protein